MIEVAVSRRAFLKGKRNSSGELLSPPWSVDDFYNHCERCGDCITACNENILIQSDGGFPAIDFKLGNCTLCGACKSACTHNALSADRVFSNNVKASFKQHCLSVNGIVCRACSDTCDQGAIRFRLHLAGRATPRLDQNLCNACGSCISVCPANAITMEKTL